MRLRSHHILCVQGFQGYGYTREFVTNMQNIVEQIRTAPDLSIELTDECDDICIACPHRADNTCSKVDAKPMDLEVLKRLGLQSGTIVPIESLLSKDFGDLSQICGGCEWKSVCSYFNKNTRDSKEVRVC